jgi:glutamine amidotransferase
MNNLVSIVDYGINNIQSVAQAFKYIGVETKITNKPSDLIDSSHIVIPGVGAFTEGMKKLKNLGLDKIIIHKAEQNSNILGICLGMQMLFTKGHEFGECDGLNLIAGEVFNIKNTNNSIKKLPIIGWRKTYSLLTERQNILAKLLNTKYFYYLHSYQAIPENDIDLIAYYKDINEVKINAAISKKKIWGVQFHPEKSGDAGLEFLRNFSLLK